ncbi:MAG: hypothetical protein KA213_00315 [Flavobacterium sp.]|nr:hypothetical protein [Flavobacterium sp.]
MFYVPGMISLVLIPVLGLCYIKSGKYLIQYQSVDLLISDSISEIIPPNSNSLSNTGYVPKRNYKAYHFDGNNDEQKLKDLVVPLKKMVEMNDTLNGVMFTFGKHSKYQTFISAQDLLFINRVHHYTVYKDNIYAFETKINKSKSKFGSIQIWTCGYRFSDDHLEAQERKAARELFIKNAKRFWQIPLALLAIIALNIYTLIKFNKNRKYNQKSYI